MAGAGLRDTHVAAGNARSRGLAAAVDTREVADNQGSGNHTRVVAGSLVLEADNCCQRAGTDDGVAAARRMEVDNAHMDLKVAARLTARQVVGNRHAAEGTRTLR